MNVTLNRIQVFKALADENRMKIIRLLINGDLCVSALAGKLSISKPAVSQHLKVLWQTGLISGEKRGYWTHYGVDKALLKQIAETMNELAPAIKLMEVCAGGLEIPMIKKMNWMGSQFAKSGVGKRKNKIVSFSNNR